MSMGLPPPPPPPRATAVISLNGRAQLSLHEGATHLEPSRDAELAPERVGAATLQVMRLLGQRMRLQISDGRVIVGTFHCLDQHRNVILTDAREYLTGAAQRREGKHGGKDGKRGGGKADARGATGASAAVDDAAWESATSRSLGMVLVPGKHLVYVKVEQAAVSG